MINIEPKQELALNALNYVVRQAATGNIKIPLSFNLTECQIKKLLTLNTQELNTIASLSNMNIMNISFDPEAIDIALEISKAKTERREEIFKLLQAGASYPVMHHLYGLTTENLGHYKKMIGIAESAGGRPVNATDEEKHLLWNMVGSESKFNDPSLAKILLDVHEKTQLKIRTIWTMLKECWNEDKDDDKGNK